MSLTVFGYPTRDPWPSSLFLGSTGHLLQFRVQQYRKVLRHQAASFPFVNFLYESFWLEKASQCLP